MISRRSALAGCRRIAEFGAMNLDGEIKPPRSRPIRRRNPTCRKSSGGFDRLSTQTKHLADTIKMIAYRAERAMAQIVRQTMSRHDDARSLLRAVYSTEVDLIPDEEAKTLTVRLHPLANTSSDEALRHLCCELNATETQFPGTELRLLYELVSAQSQ
jgi:hypothetical protein